MIHPEINDIVTSGELGAFVFFGIQILRDAFDSAGNLWGTTVYSDKLFVLTPQGDLRVLLDEGDPKKVDALEKQFFEGKVTENVLFATGRGVAPWMASVTFGGADLQTVYIGSLKGSRIPYFRAPVPGLPMVHWNEKPRPLG